MSESKVFQTDAVSPNIVIVQDSHGNYRWECKSCDSRGVWYCFRDHVEGLLATHKKLRHSVYEDSENRYTGDIADIHGKRELLHSVAADFLIANEAANQAEDDGDTANQIMFDTFQRFVDAVGFGFDADCVDVARLVVDLTKNETNVSKMSEFPEDGNFQ